jgi:predicted lipoprotein with Yx(FWY)xxD motif
MKTSKLVLTLLLAATLGACSSTAYKSAAPAMASGDVLTGSNGMTLYTFDKDAGGKSMCNGPCATNWPPLYAMDSDVASGDYSIVIRDDGKKQWALKGKPLYFWVKDQKAGDKTGDNFNNVWHVAKP